MMARLHKRVTKRAGRIALATAAVAFAAGVVTGAMFLHSLAANEAPQGVVSCETEDAVGPCTWDATKQGNGLGKSFTVNSNGTITYDKH